MRKESIFILQKSLKLTQFFKVYPLRCKRISDSQTCRLSHRFTKQCTGCHNTDTAHCHMSHAYVSSCKEKIFHVFRIKCTVRYGVRCRRHTVGVGCSLVVKATGEMVIEGPSSVGNLIVENNTVRDISLGNHYFSHHPP